ncbi:MAG: hypothetical protein AB7E79_04110 [Rhodospirillaceae bacterium]
MTFRIRSFAAPAVAAALIAGYASATVSAAPLQKATLADTHAQVTLVDHRDGRWRGDRGRDRHWRGHRGGDRRQWRGVYARPYYRPHYPPRYAYAPPAYYYPPYDYYDYPYSGGYFSFSSPNLGLSFGY